MKGNAAGKSSIDSQSSSDCVVSSASPGSSSKGSDISLNNTRKSFVSSSTDENNRISEDENGQSSDSDTDDSASALGGMVKIGDWEGVILAAEQFERRLDDGTAHTKLSCESQVQNETA